MSVGLSIRLLAGRVSRLSTDLLGIGEAAHGPAELSVKALVFFSSERGYDGTLYLRISPRCRSAGLDYQCLGPLFLTRTERFHAHHVTLIEGVKIFCCAVVIPLLFILTFDKLRSLIRWLASLHLQKLIRCWKQSLLFSGSLGARLGWIQLFE